MTARFPPWMIVAIVVQLVLAGLFFLFVYSLSSSLAQGAAPAAMDVMMLAMPLAAVAILGITAVAAWRAGRASAAALLVCAPLPLCFVLFALQGLF